MYVALRNWKINVSRQHLLLFVMINWYHHVCLYCQIPPYQNHVIITFITNVILIFLIIKVYQNSWITCIIRVSYWSAHEKYIISETKLINCSTWTLVGIRTCVLNYSNLDDQITVLRSSQCHFTLIRSLSLTYCLYTYHSRIRIYEYMLSTFFSVLCLSSGYLSTF